MYTIRILIHCSDRYIEVLPEELENTEFIIEDLVSQVLVELFGTVIVDEVIVRYFPSEQEHYDPLTYNVW